MNAKTCKKFRKLARMLARGKEKTTYNVMRVPSRRRGEAPQVMVTPNCVRGVYLQMKRSHHAR